MEEKMKNLLYFYAADCMFVNYGPLQQSSKEEYEP